MLLTYLSLGHDDLRMVGGGSPCAGLLQIYRWGEWWTPTRLVSDQKKVQNTLQVIGSEHDCGSLDFFQPSDYSYNFENIVGGEDFCNGSESKLLACKAEIFTEIKFPPRKFHMIIFTGRHHITRYTPHYITCIKYRFIHVCLEIHPDFYWSLNCVYGWKEKKRKPACL